MKQLQRRRAASRVATIPFKPPREPPMLVATEPDQLPSLLSRQVRKARRFSLEHV
jgi:hypothetical protein